MKTVRSSIIDNLIDFVLTVTFSGFYIAFSPSKNSEPSLKMCPFVPMYVSFPIFKDGLLNINLCLKHYP